MSTNSKAEILQEAKYRYASRHAIYFNKMAKKIFSLEAIEDHDAKWLKECIKKKDSEWNFYFNNAPRENVKEEIIDYLKEKNWI